MPRLESGEVFRHTIPEDTGFVVRARIQLDDGTDITQSVVSSATYTVTDLSTRNAVSGHNGVSLTVSSLVYDTLQIDDNAEGWQTDDNGWNIKHIVAASAFPEGDRVYEYRCVYVFSNGSPNYTMVGHITVQPVQD